ncbi:transcriptional regulator, partial [Thiorhodococcus mannitoliphagus]|nr:transcriptional regulator [Thiorhodococcus mannitoliphagus]
NRPEPRPLAALLDDLSSRLAMADPAVREEVTRLVLRYLENPPAGARIAKAIELLLGQDEDPPTSS